MHHVVIVHNGAWNFFENNIVPNWLEVYPGMELHVVCPFDDLVTVVDRPWLKGVFPVGRSCREGVSCIDRMRFGAAMLGTLGGVGMLLEYDVMFVPGRWKTVLTEKLLGREMLTGLLFNDPEGKRFDGARFEGRQFGHAPWVAVAGMWRLLAGSSFQAIEYGVPDRWLGYQCGVLNIPMVSLGGFSKNTVEPQDYTLMDHNIRQPGGVPCVHGIKVPQAAKVVSIAARNREGA